MYAIAVNSECTDTIKEASHYILPLYHPPYHISHEGYDIDSELSRHLELVIIVTLC
jgi:hypothetical protein